MLQNLMGLAVAHLVVGIIDAAVNSACMCQSVQSVILKTLVEPGGVGSGYFGQVAVSVVGVNLLHHGAGIDGLQAVAFAGLVADRASFHARNAY